MWPIWLVLAGIFFIVEIATTGFLVFWLGIGSLFAMITKFFYRKLNYSNGGIYYNFNFINYIY